MLAEIRQKNVTAQFTARMIVLHKNVFNILKEKKNYNLIIIILTLLSIWIGHCIKILLRNEY